MWCGGTKIGVKVDLANGDWRLLKIMDSITSSIADANSVCAMMCRVRQNEYLACFLKLFKLNAVLAQIDGAGLKPSKLRCNIR